MRLLLSTFGTGGDIIPFSRLARMMLARRHAVTVHTWPHYRAWFPEAVTFVPAAGGVDSRAVDENLDWALRAPSYIEQVRRFGRLFYGLGDGPARARAYYDQAREAFGGHDLALINTLDHVGQAAAEDSALAWVCFTSRPPPDPARADALFGEVDRAVSDHLAEVTGKRRPVRVFRAESSLRTFAACSRHLAEPFASPSTLCSGAWLEPPRPDPLPEAIEDFVAAGPTLFVTFGTMPDVNGRTDAIVAAAARTGWRALLQVLPPAPPPAALPGGVLVVRDRVRFDALLPRVAAVVHHGGSGTVHEVLRAGRPSLAIPHMGDQFYWAALLEHRGLGPPPLHFTELDSDTLARRLMALREERFRGATEALAPKLAAEDGLSFACAEIERLAD